MKSITLGIAVSFLACAFAGCGGGIESRPTITAKPKPGQAVGNGGVVAKTNGGTNGKKNGGGGTGTLSGVIKYTGDAPKIGLAAGYTNKDPYCTANKSKIKDESLIVGTNKGLANVILFLDRKPRGYTAPKPPADPALFDQKFCTFVPHVLSVRVGQTVELKNSDDTTHNTHITPNNNEGYNKSLGKGKDFYTYANREKGPVKVVCDAHTWMYAYHLPLDHPFVFVTKNDGAFTIEGLPAGTHNFKIWHEKGGVIESVPVTIRAGETTTLNRSYGAAKLSRFRGPRPKVVVFSPR
ncbi:MAG: carboxypeptidase regulatory-like domain-containing protein [Planctomycetaceae bacterium]